MYRPNAKVFRTPPQVMDSEREKFRTYLEKSGVMSVFTDVLVHLYEEPSRPSDALSYVKNALGTITVDQVRVQMYQDKVSEQAARIEALEKENAELKQQLSASRGQAETTDAQQPSSKTEEPPVVE